MDSRRSADHRLAIIEGHIRAVRKMVAGNAPPIEIIRQSKAVQKALQKFDAMMLDQYLNTQVAADLAAGKTDKATKEILRVFELV